jgi:hypothetical protein
MNPRRQLPNKAAMYWRITPPRMGLILADPFFMKMLYRAYAFAQMRAIQIHFL